LDEGEAVVDIGLCCRRSAASGGWLEISPGRIGTNGGGCSSPSGELLETAGTTGEGAGRLEMFQTKLFIASCVSW